MQHLKRSTGNARKIGHTLLAQQYRQVRGGPLQNDERRLKRSRMFGNRGCSRQMINFSEYRYPRGLVSEFIEQRFHAPFCLITLRLRQA